MDVKDVFSYGPALLVPSAWLLVLFNVSGRVSSHSVFIAHIVMIAFLTAFVYIGWDRMSDGVMKAWRTVILVGIPFTALGLAGFLTEVSEMMSFVPVILYWATVPSLTSIYTGLEAENINVNLLAGGTVATLGMILSAFWMFDLFYFSWPGFALLAAGQFVTLIEAIRLDR